MDKNVAIVSYGLMPYKGPNEIGMWNDEATYIVSRQAIEKAGINREDLDSVVISTMDGLDGITISNGLLVPAAGAYEKSSIRIENSGAHCVMSGVADILSGNADLVMVASSDTIELDLQYVANSNQDQFFRGPIGFNVLQSYGLLSMDYLRKTGALEEDFALAASKSYQCGAANPYARAGKAYTVEEVMASPLAAWPLRDLEIGGLSNGAAALILASEEKARELMDNPVWITGIAMASNSYMGSWQDLSGMPAMKEAAQKAYRMAGIENPRQELDFMEVFNTFSAFELIAYESLGICEQGQGPALLREGVTSPGGDFPVNLSGGSLCTNGPNSSGVFRIIQSAMQLNGEAEGMKVKNPKKGLVHDSDMVIGAVGGDSQAIMILEKEV
ncbi:MAG: thiolase family protein [Thermodesulfobacteriota bacterium]|nr:thiolase family protein [Thermodesulfobacteriota bacterium]